MHDKQFTVLMTKLDEICFNTSHSINDTKPLSVNTFDLQELFFNRLDKKTDWGRNEIKLIFEDSIKELTA